MAGAEALCAMETRAIRKAQLETYTSSLGSIALLTMVFLWLTLPPLWSVVNGEWSSAILPSLLATAGHGVFVVSMLLVLRVAQVQGEELLLQLSAKYLTHISKPNATSAPQDGTALIDEILKLKSLRGRLSAGNESSKKKPIPIGSSFFDFAPIKTVEDGKVYLRRLQKAQKEKEAEESMHSASAYGMENSYQSDAFGIYGNASMVPRVYQASGFDPYFHDISFSDEEDPLRTSSLPHIAWQQLEEWGLAMFMHLYCRNIRRLLAYHVKDVVEAFLENANALNECGVMADVLLRRVPSQALLCPPGQTNQLTNVSLSDMLQNLARDPLFYSRERDVYLFEEHRSFDKYLYVGDPSSTDSSSLERQQYVLERLIMLSKDRSLDRFRWNKGSAWKGKGWTDVLPTDAEILMNTFCCLMDNMLPADNGRDRPFWKSYYFSKGPNRPFTPRVRSRLFLVKTVGRPPHFKALVKGAVREIVPGEENCFHAIVVYLHAVKKMKAGYLESINLHRIIEQAFDVSNQKTLKELLRMKFAYQFQHLCGSVYSQGNVIFTPDGNSVLSPVGNRITQFDVINNTSRTFAFEARKNIERVAVSHDSRLLLVVDEDGRCLLVNLKRGAVLYRFHFKQPVKALIFSPDDRFIAVAIGNKVQLWRTPGLVREFAPFVLHRTYTGHYADVVSVSWSHDAKFFVTSSDDLSARVFSVDPYPNFKPLTLSGHRDVVVGAFFAADDRSIFTVGRDGGSFEWKYKLLDVEKLEETSDESDDEQSEQVEVTKEKTSSEESDLSSQSENQSASMARKRKLPEQESIPEIARAIKWYTCQKHVLKMDFAKVLCCTFHSSTGILVVGFGNGTFGLYELPAFVNIHTLSVTQNELETVTVNATGEWLAFASRKLGQLLVWEWRSETYVLKQQGHYFDLNAASYSPDGRLLATGADDAKLKLWDTNSGFCYITFTEHVAPVTAVQFAPSGQAVLSASLDGTVRAFDLNRYKNFRVLTTPEPTQFLSLALDPSGQVVCAGSMDPFNVYVWSLQTGRLTDVLSGHSGPVTSLSFSPSLAAEPILASASWDHTVRLWNLFANKVSFIEPLAHPTDVLAVAFRPDGKQLASTTLNGAINIWDVKDGEQIGTIDGKRDIAGGRKEGDLITAANNQLTKHFTSVCYSADGMLLLAGGRSKFVCIYAVKPQLLLKKFQISHNLSLDGILEKLNNKNVTESGLSKSALDAHLDDAEASGRKNSDNLVGAKRAVDPGSRRKNMEVMSKAVLFSPTGRAWAAATTEGLLIYGLDESLAFDPFELDEDITPESITQALARREYSRALVMALHLNEEPLIARCVEGVPVASIPLVAQTLHGEMYLQRLLQLLAKRMERSPHLEFYLQWSLAVLNTHGQTLRDDPSNSGTCLPTLRSLQKSIARHLQDLAKICDDNQFTLSYLKNLSKMQQMQKPH